MRSVQAHTILYQSANEYVNFEIAGKTINIPYSVTREGMAKYAIGNDDTGGLTDKSANYGGKGTPEQIRKILITTAENERFDVYAAKREQIIQFMIDHGIGIDCSGFVYNVLNAYMRRAHNTTLDTIILRYGGLIGKTERLLLQHNRVRRASAATLTNDLNTVEIKTVQDMQPGDMIRLTHADWKGKHIAIIISIDSIHITYSMSSQYTKTQGTRFAKIKILDAAKGLESQHWMEVTKKGKNYGKDAFDPQRGDSVRRLKLFLRV